MHIETERLLLRDFTPHDWRQMLGYQSDPRYLQFYPWQERSEEDVKSFLQMFLDQQRASPRTKFQLAITIKGNDNVIGNCGVRRVSIDSTEADLGYELSPDYWGNGYATEAATAMADFAFRELGVHRIWAHCLEENQASTRVLERLGMQVEGRLRDKEYFKGRWWTVLIYSVLEQEWSLRSTS